MYLHTKGNSVISGGRCLELQQLLTLAESCSPSFEGIQSPSSRPAARTVGVEGRGRQQPDAIALDTEIPQATHNDDKVVANRLLLELLEVLGENLQKVVRQLARQVKGTARECSRKRACAGK